MGGAHVPRFSPLGKDTVDHRGNQRPHCYRGNILNIPCWFGKPRIQLVEQRPHVFCQHGYNVTPEMDRLTSRQGLRVHCGDHSTVGSQAAAHNLAVLKHITLNLIRLDPIKRKGGVKARRLIAATSDSYRAELLGLR